MNIDYREALSLSLPLSLPPSLFLSLSLSLSLSTYLYISRVRVNPRYINRGREVGMDGSGQGGVTKEHRSALPVKQWIQLRGADRHIFQIYYKNITYTHIHTHI